MAPRELAAGAASGWGVVVAIVGGIAKGVFAVVIGLMVLGWYLGSHDRAKTYAPPSVNRSSGSSFDPGYTTEGLKIADLDSESTGIGDGSFYEHITVTNTGTHHYDYIEIDATCTDASGTTIDTAMGNETNVPPNARIVIDAIFMHGRDCETVHAQFGEMTG